MIFAASYGHDRTLHSLIQAGAAVNRTDNTNAQLLEAATYGFYKRVDILKKGEADVNASSHLGESALMLAA